MNNNNNNSNNDKKKKKKKILAIIGFALAVIGVTFFTVAMLNYFRGDKSLYYFFYMAIPALIVSFAFTVLGTTKN